MAKEYTVQKGKATTTMTTEASIVLPARESVNKNAGESELDDRC